MLPSFLCLLALQDDPAVLEARLLVERLRSSQTAERAEGRALLDARRREAADPQARRARVVVGIVEAETLLTPGLRQLHDDFETWLRQGELSKAWGYGLFRLRDLGEGDELSAAERGLVCEGAIRYAGSQEDLVQALQEVRFRTAPVPVDVLRSGLRSDVPEVRQVAVRALSVQSDKAAAGTAARPLLKDPEGDVRRAAAEAAGRLGDTQAVGDLRTLLSDPDARFEAAMALGRLGAREAEADLRALLKQERVRVAAAHALADLGVDDAPALLLEVLAQGEFSELDDTAAKMAGMGPRGVAALREGLGRPRADVRRAALEALVSARVDRAEADATALLKDPDARVRAEAARSLARLSLRSSFPALRQALGDPGWETRRWAAFALGALDAKEAAPDLRPRLADESNFVKIEAAEALCRMGDAAGADVLLKTSSEWYLLMKRVVPLTAMNALRSPELWSRLADRRIEAPVEGGTVKVLEALAAAAGVALHLPEDDSDDDSSDDPWLERRLSISPAQRPTIVEVLLGIRASGAFDFILEKDALRVVPHAQALRFWKEWWAQRKK